MIKMGGFRAGDPMVMAIHFYAPILLLLTQYDDEPSKESQGLALLEQHVRQFASLYSKD